MKILFNAWLVAGAIAISLICSSAAQANTQAIVGLSDPQLVGKARLKVMLWNVFDAALYSETGSYDKDSTFALELTYLRRLKASSVVDKTIEEIKRLNPAATTAQINRWEAKLVNIIPEVRKGTNITGVRTADGYTEFYSAGKPLGSVRDKQFTQTFFDIWLGKDTAKPRMRKKLIGA